MVAICPLRPGSTRSKGFSYAELGNMQFFLDFILGKMVDLRSVMKWTGTQRVGASIVSEVVLE